MTPSNDAIARVKQILKSFFDSRNMEVNADSVRMWLDAFADMPVDQIELAFRRFNREHEGHVSPAAVRKYAGTAGLTDDSRAQVAWRSVRKAVGQYGAYYSIEFDDAIIHGAVRAIGGWCNLCKTPHSEMQWKAKQFVEEYVSIARTGIGEVKPLSGSLMMSPRAEVVVGLLPHAGFKALTYHDSGHSGQPRITNRNGGE
jgi:hypothetical protein